MTKVSQPSELGMLLKQWRDIRGRSQLQLSADCGISQRQISFIESGRSNPTRESLMGIAQSLAIPLRERNALLLAAGYAPVYSEASWTSEEMSSVTSALKRLLLKHEPYPAVVMDRYWNVLLANEAAPKLFNSFVDLYARPSPRNILHLMFDPQGMRPFIANWGELAKSLIQRVYRESVGQVADARVRDLISQLLAYPEVLSEWRSPEPFSALPVVPMRFVKDGRVMTYFSLVTTVGAAQAVSAQELRVECMYPADQQTEEMHTMLMERPSAEH